MSAMNEQGVNTTTTTMQPLSGTGNNINDRMALSLQDYINGVNRGVDFLEIVNGTSLLQTISESMFGFAQDFETLCIYLLESGRVSVNFLNKQISSTVKSTWLRRLISHAIVSSYGIPHVDMTKFFKLAIQKYNYDINTEDPQDRATPVLIAMEKGVCDLVRLFMGMGANLNVADNRGNTLVHLICKISKHVDVAEEVLTKLDPYDLINKKNSFGDTPLDVCIRRDFEPSMMELLLKHGADPYMCKSQYGLNFYYVTQLHEKIQLRRENEHLRKKIEYLWWRPGGPGFEECQTRFESGTYSPQSSNTTGVTLEVFLNSTDTFNV